MEKKIVSVAAIVLFMLLVFSGCTEQQDSPTNTDHTFTAGTTETFSVNSTGGEFSLFNDNLKVNVPSMSVPQDVDITITTIQSPVDDSSLAVVSCFDFGPDGTLYAMEQFTATTGHLYSIDINTLSRSDYFGEFQYENGLAIVPEPCTLFLLGLGGLGLLRKRRA